MGVQTLHKYAENNVDGAAEPVELIQIARSIQNGKNKGIKPLINNSRLCLVLDAECCLDRLYGGYFSDWTCGGQWNRMVQFLNQLFTACQKGNIEVTVAFNGALEQQRLAEWAQLQQTYRQNVHMVVRHVQIKGTPPPKVWWIPPTCLSTALKMALRYLNIPMMCSMDDHHQEVLAYCRENNMDGIIGDDAEYLVFAPPRYFSATSLKLTFKGFIETKEIFVSKVEEALGLDTLGLSILTTLLGNYLLPETELAGLYAKLKINSIKEVAGVVVALAEFVKNLENRDNLEILAGEIFGNEKSDKFVKRRQLFVESVQYYLNGTKDGFLKYKPRKSTKKRSSNQKKEEGNSGGESSSSDGQVRDSSRFASETVENEAGSLQAYTELAELKRGKNKFLLGEEEETGSLGSAAASSSATTSSDPAAVNGTDTSTQTGPSHASDSQPTPGPSEKKEKDGRKVKKLNLPPEVIRTAGERHQKGVMSPLIYHVLTQREVKLPVLLEDEHLRDIPNVHQLYRPVRQSIYAILLNVHHEQYLAREQGDNSPLVMPTIKEWSHPYTKPEIVEAEPISWSVPTVQRLWFGTNIEDMRRRLRAFLTCMKSDSPLMVSANYVPQHLLVMASVLRYLMQSPVPILRQLELDAFIVTAFCPDLMDSDFTQELQLPIVTARGVHLATMFMQGVETALWANEACGAPIPYLMCCPWLFFDGKLFHNILAKTEFVKSLQELCNHRMDVLVKVERMRHAILENLHVQYARRGVANISNTVLPYAVMPAGYNNSVDRRPGPMRGNQRRTVSARGGQLEVAGVVVCSWGPNYSLARDRNQPPPLGGMTGGRGFNRNFNEQRGFPVHGRGGFGGRRRTNPPRRPKAKKSGERRTRGRGSSDAPPIQTQSSENSSSSLDDLNGPPDVSAEPDDDTTSTPAAACVSLA